MWRFGLWALRALLAALTFAASVGPEAMDSNLSGWLTRLGFSNLPTFIADSRVDQPVALVALIFLLGTLLPWRRWLGIIQGPKSDRSLLDQPQRPSDNTFVGTSPRGLEQGSRNTVINAADTRGNVDFSRGGTAIGAGAEADSTSVAIGSGALGGEAADALRRELAPKIEHISNYIARAEYEEARQCQRKLIEYLEVRRIPVPERMEDPKIAMRLDPGPLYASPEIMVQFTKAGIPASVVRERVDAEEQRIRGDAAYYVLDAKEESVWASGEEKRMWHIKDAQLVALINLAKEFEQWWQKRT